MRVIFYSLLFLSSYPFLAQNRIEQVISSNTETILVELESLNSFELKSTKEHKFIKVVCTNCDQITTPELSDQNQVVSIKVSSDTSKIYGAQRDKYRAGQPDFPNYIIEIPENKDVKIIYDKGNFKTKSFTGDIDIRLNHGKLKLDDIKGNISVTSFSGVIDCTLNEGEIKIENSKGKTINKLIDSKLKLENNNLTGIYKNNKTALSIKTIHAKVLLRATITQ